MKITMPGIILLRHVAEYGKVTCLLDNVITKDEVLTFQQTIG